MECSRVQKVQKSATGGWWRGLIQGAGPGQCSVPGCNYNYENDDDDVGGGGGDTLLGFYVQGCHSF